MRVTWLKKQHVQPDSLQASGTWDLKLRVKKLDENGELD